LVLYEALDLQYYTSLGPGPGFFPFWVALILGVLAACMIYQAMFHEPAALPPDFFPDKRGRLRIGGIVLNMAAAIALLEPLGFRLTMLAFFVVLLLSLGRPRPVVTALVALAGSFGAFFVFDTLLHVPLPVGRFGI
jgi:putative tricarboxylic transport membrane protein